MARRKLHVVATSYERHTAVQTRVVEGTVKLTESLVRV
jgi:hypothetical protein